MHPVADDKSSMSRAFVQKAKSSRLGDTLSCLKLSIYQEQDQDQDAFSLFDRAFLIDHPA